MNVKNLYLTKNEPIWFEVAQGAAGVQFGIRVQDYTIPAGAVVNIYVSKPDGTLVYNAAEVSGNTITVTTTTQMTAVVGVSNCQVQILSTGILLRTFVFHLKVRESIIDETAIESTDEFGALETALQTVSEYDADILALQNGVASLNSSIGDFKCVSFSLTYQQNDSVLTIVQRAYAHESMPKGVPFIALVAHGAYYIMQGYWYAGGNYGFCNVSLYWDSYQVFYINGAWSIRGTTRVEDVASGYLTTATALGTSFGIIPFGDDLVLRGNFSRVSDGGYRALRTGPCKITAFAYMTSLNTDDTAIFNVSRYNSGWVYESPGVLAVGKTERSMSFPTMVMTVNENDIIYLRGRNTTAARGSVTSARILIEPTY